MKTCFLISHIPNPRIRRRVVENRCHEFDRFLGDIDLIVIMVKHKHLFDKIEKLDTKVIFDTKSF